MKAQKPAAGAAETRRVFHIQASSSVKEPAAPRAPQTAAADAGALEDREHANELLWWSCYTLLGYAYIGMPLLPHTCPSAAHASMRSSWITCSLHTTIVGRARFTFIFDLSVLL